jgi:hypothetical protein
MATLFRIGVLLALVAGVTRPAEAAKTCREPVIADPLGIWGCGSTFTKSGTSDVGGNKDDKLQARSKRLWWWIHTDENIKIEFRNFNEYGTSTPYCPGTFKVDGTSYTNCQFTVKDNQPGWTVVKFKGDQGAVGKTVKFDIVITNNGTPYTIDPQIEIDTDHNLAFQWIVAVAVVSLLALVTLVTFGLIRLFRRGSGEAR